MSNNDNSSFFSHVSSDMSIYSDNKSNIISCNNDKKSIDTMTNISSFDNGRNNSSSNSSSDSSRASNSINDFQKTRKYKTENLEMHNKIYIDVAVIHEEYNKIEVNANYHIIDLDEICVSLELFQMMFYPYKEQFGINRDFFKTNSLISLISFLGEYRTVNCKKFYLLEELLGNIETDLCISRNCFTKESLVEMTNEITMIRSILDIKCCSILSSLTWSNILDIIDNYKSIKEKCISIPVLIINIVFHTPTPGVKDTIIRFMYKITDL